MVDALASGASDSNIVRVRVSLSPHKFTFCKRVRIFVDEASCVSVDTAKYPHSYYLKVLLYFRKDTYIVFLRERGMCI